VDEKYLQNYPQKHSIWKIEQKVNFGIGEARLKISDLQKYWNKIDIDKYKRKALSLVLFK